MYSFDKKRQQNISFVLHKNNVTYPDLQLLSVWRTLHIAIQVNIEIMWICIIKSQIIQKISTDGLEDEDCLLEVLNF